MRTTLIALSAVAGIAGVAAPASAQAWTPIQQRQANLYNRIEQGVRNGALTRAEASRLRSDFTALARLDGRYSRNGYSRAEVGDLQRRYDALSRRVYVTKHNGRTRY
ncbi:MULTISPECIES: hypothetical protein [Sphingomonas]|uniref:hypothetical protein n=1 Tax=Sphingomonas TaxID=13687 RepID=UPI000DEFE275|nr:MULTISPECIES: hypothetical protein [Sphingomonas]